MKLPKERRQVEILALIGDTSANYSVADLCEHFSVEVATIHRDLQELRGLGLSIHSLRGAVQITRPLTEADLRLLLSRYVSFVGNAVAFPKSTSVVVKKLKGRSLLIFTELVRAIEKRRAVEIQYYKMFDDTLVTRTIEPYQLFSTSREWMLIARSDDIFKHFLLQNIREIKQTEQFFKRQRDFDASDFYRLSFDYWSGNEVFEVTLRFTKDVAHVIANGIWGEDQEIFSQNDGSVILKMRVNSLEQVGNWILTWGGDVRVLQPESLREQLKSKASLFASRNE